MVERYGCARFDMQTLAEFLGISRMSLHRRMHRGTVPRPAIVETPEWGGTKCYWSPRQVAEMVVAGVRGYGGSPPQPCGTYAAYRRHLNRGEPADAACRQ